MNNSAMSGIADNETAVQLVSTSNGLLATGGRIGRIEFFWAQLFAIIIIMVAGVIATLLAQDKFNALAFLIVLPLTFIAIYVSCVAGVKRCHDLDKSGWLYLLIAIPIVGSIFSLYLLFAKGAEQNNKYGASLYSKAATLNRPLPPTPVASVAGDGPIQSKFLSSSTSPSSSQGTSFVRPIATASNIPSEDMWAAAIAEFDSVARRPGLWARSFSESQGDEGAAKANYLRYRTDELQGERVVSLAQELVVATAAKAAASITHLLGERRTYAELPKGMCPNCESALLLLTAKTCTKCSAIFGHSDGWKVMPTDKYRQVEMLKKAFLLGKKLTVDEVIFLVSCASSDSLISKIKNYYSETLLHKTAAFDLHYEAKTLIVYGADASAINSDGKKPFQLTNDTELKCVLRKAAGEVKA